MRLFRVEVACLSAFGWRPVVGSQSVLKAYTEGWLDALCSVLHPTYRLVAVEVALDGSQNLLEVLRTVEHNTVRR